MRKNYKREEDKGVDYTRNAEFWAKANPQRLYWYMVDNPEKAKLISKKAGATLAKNLR